MILIHGCTNTLMYFQRFKTLTIHCWQTDRTLWNIAALWQVCILHCPLLWGSDHRYEAQPRKQRLHLCFKSCNSWDSSQKFRNSKLQKCLSLTAPECWTCLATAPRCNLQMQVYSMDAAPDSDPAPEPLFVSATNNDKVRQGGEGTTNRKPWSWRKHIFNIYVTFMHVSILFHT